MSFLTKKSALCALLTDFGQNDHYVGVMKGVLLGAAPAATLVDLTHTIPAQDIRSGAFQLLVSARFFPENTLFVAIVDPGVGSDRPIIYAESGGRRFLAPDNGILSWALEMAPPKHVIAVSKALSSGSGLSRTFHGRDVFAPLAARLLNEEKPSALGSRVTEWVKIPFPSVKKTGSRWTGEVMAIDRFGNLITNITNEDLLPLTPHSKIWIDLGKKGGSVRNLSSSYSAVPKGRLLAIEGSSGFIEIAERDGSAARQTGLHVGSRIGVSFKA